MDFFDEEKWAKVMAPVLQALVEQGIDRASVKLAPVLQQAIKDGLDGLTVDMSINVEMKVRRREGT